MKYRDLLQEYKNGTLDEEKKKEIEADIEKQDAISDFLFENSEIPGLDDIADSDAIPEDNKEMKPSSEADDFAKLINSRIRRAFIKVGITTALVTLAIVGFVMFALPKIVDGQYYNPTEEIGSGFEKSNRLTVDVATYSELFLPTRNIWNCDAVSRGYGKYYISLYRMENSYAGTLEKGDLRLYYPDILNRTIKLAFTSDENGQSTCLLTSPKGSFDYEPDIISYLDEYHVYQASVTMTKSMRYDDFVKWCEQNDIYPDWCAISTYVQGGDPENLPLMYSGIEHNAYTNEPCIGFGVDSYMRVNYDQEKYPNLSAWDTWQAIRDGASEYDVTFEHVTSMLDYLIDNPEIIYMIPDGNADPDTLRSYKKHIEANGLYVYGFVCADNKEGFERMQNLDEVAHIVVDVE